MGHGQAEGHSGDLESQNLTGNSQGRIWLLTPWGVKPRNSVTLPRRDVLVLKQIRFCDSRVNETHFAFRP